MFSRQDLLEKYCNEYSRFAVINGSLVHYRDEGEGMPVLLLHGAFSSLHTFDDWTDLLKEHYRIIRLDLPGLGLSDPPASKSKFSLEIYKNCILELLRQIGVPRCHIVGNSLGGWLAWELALQHPKQFAKMILLAPAGFMDSRSIPIPFKMAQTPFVDKIAHFAIKRNLVDLFLRQVYIDKSKVSDELVDRYYDLFSKEGNPETFFRLVNGKFKDVTNKMHKIKNETLIIWGELDEWLPINNAFRFKDAIPNSELIIYDDLGHIIMEEAPEPSAEDVKDFLGLDVKLALTG